MNLLLPCCYIALCSAQNLVSVPWSSRSYGLDGPWPAVSVNFGGFPNNQEVDSLQWETFDLFPGTFYDSFILTSTACGTNSSGLCAIGGHWDDSNQNQTIDGTEIDFMPFFNTQSNSSVYLVGKVYAQTMNVGYTTDGNQGGTCYNSSTTVASTAIYALPGGKNTSAVEIGYLAVGADQQTQQFIQNESGQTLVTTWNLPGYFYNHSITHSNSFSLQLGSVAYNYPGSLIFGGYDKGRLIGPLTTTGNDPFRLLDITVGIAYGGSPFNFSSKSGLLLDEDRLNQPINVFPDPTSSYLSLPKHTCDNLASLLPVQLDPSGYYLWNTTDPDYQRIVQSPAYLGFTFPASSGDTEPVVIKVPFALLNLTLDSILSGKGSSVPYFPCIPYEPSQPQTGWSPDGNYIIGRAFLQAAFLGRNWGQQISWLAQAPGPGASLAGLGTDPVNIQASDNSLDTFTGDDLFASSWEPYLTALSATPTTPAVVQKKDSALSTGAKAGIGAGAGIGGLLLIGGIAFFFMKRQTFGSNSEHETLVYSPSQNIDGKQRFQPDPMTCDNPVQLDEAVQLHEIHGVEKRELVELPGADYSELHGVCAIGQGKTR